MAALPVTIGDDAPTPQEFWRQLDAEFGFTLDVAASQENTKCAAFYTLEDDGLQQPWAGVVWCNPPYSDIGPWIERARLEATAGRATTVLLVPSRTDQGWWHDHVADGKAEVRWIRGRLRFGGRKQSAPFPCCLVIYRAARRLGQDVQA
jgi:phage N-6-adenine-methyltransferase